MPTHGSWLSVSISGMKVPHLLVRVSSKIREPNFYGVTLTLSSFRKWKLTRLLTGEGLWLAVVIVSGAKSSILYRGASRQTIPAVILRHNRSRAEKSVGEIPLNRSANLSINSFNWDEDIVDQPCVTTNACAWRKAIWRCWIRTYRFWFGTICQEIFH